MSDYNWKLPDGWEPIKGTIPCDEWKIQLTAALTTIELALKQKEHEVIIEMEKQFEAKILKDDDV